MSQIKIEDLTEAQKAKMQDYVDKWKDIGLSTTPANRALAEKLLHDTYRINGFNDLERIIWTRSPYEMLYVYAYLLHDKVVQRDLTAYPPSAEKSDEEIYQLVEDNKEWLTKYVKENFNSLMEGIAFGYHSASWLSFYDFIRNECNIVEDTEKLQPYSELSQHVGWLIPCSKVCIISEKHTGIHLDENERLHSTTQAAIEFMDKWGVYSVHGVRIPPWFITEPTRLTVEAIDNEDNTELQRIMIDLYGDSKYLMDSGAVLIDEHFDEIDHKHYKLYHKVMQDDEDIVMVKVINATAEPDGTFREYYLSVPPEIRNAREAVAWTFSETAETYHPEIET